MIRIPQGDCWREKGHWKGAGGEGFRTANVSCPNCGMVFSLSHHKIDESGNVSPSVVCAHGCGFHDYVKLEGWGS